MPTQRVSELLVPATELSEREWVSVIDEWVRVLGPVFKGTRFPRLGELVLSNYILALDIMLQQDHVAHDLPLELEGIWVNDSFSISSRGKGLVPFWGLDRKGNWYEGSVEVTRHSDGHRASYRLLSAEVNESNLQSITKRFNPESIIAKIRGQIATFQKRARDKEQHYNHYGQLLDGDLMLLKEAGVRIPYTPALADLLRM